MWYSIWRTRVCVTYDAAGLMDPCMNSDMGRMSEPYGGNEGAD